MKKSIFVLVIVLLAISVTSPYANASDSSSEDIEDTIKQLIEEIPDEKPAEKISTVRGKLKITKKCIASVRGVTFQMPGASAPGDTCAALNPYKGIRVKIKGVLHRRDGRKSMDNIESIKVLEKPVKKWMKINGVFAISKGDQANVSGILFDFPSDKNISEYESKNVEVYGQLYTQFCNPYPYEQCMDDGALRVMTRVKTIKILDTENTSNTSSFALNFFAGSLLESSFEVKITDSLITYQEIYGLKEITKPERSLLPAELADIRKAATDARLVTFQSENFTQDPLLPDQGYYRIALSIDGKENMLECRISAPEETRDCQRQIDPLRLKLNSILGVNIY